MRRVWAHYLGNVTLIDEKVGQLLASLKERGYLDDAVVIFTSDHGECLGDHGLSQKWSMYDVVTRVPTIAWSTAGRFAGGRRVDGLCQWFDLGPTILELAGLSRPPPSRRAASCRRWKAGPGRRAPTCSASRAATWRCPAPSSSPACGTSAGSSSTSRDRSEGQLFDLAADPGEVDNLWDDPAHLDTRRALLDVIRDWLIESNVRTRDRQAATR